MRPRRWILRGIVVALLSLAIAWYIDRSFADNASILTQIVIWFYMPALFVFYFLSGGVHASTSWTLIMAGYGAVLVQNLFLWAFFEWVRWRVIDTHS